jgi:hypothetical protein
MCHRQSFFTSGVAFGLDSVDWTVWIGVIGLHPMSVYFENVPDSGFGLHSFLLAFAPGQFFNLSGKWSLREKFLLWNRSVKV